MTDIQLSDSGYLTFPLLSGTTGTIDDVPASHMGEHGATIQDVNPHVAIGGHVVTSLDNVLSSVDPWVGHLEACSSCRLTLPNWAYKAQGESGQTDSSSGHPIHSLSPIDLCSCCSLTLITILGFHHLFAHLLPPRRWSKAKVDYAGSPYHAH